MAGTGLRGPPSERPPLVARPPPVDAGLRVAAAVRRVRAGARRHVPERWIVRIDGNRPGVVPVPPVVGRLPGLAAILGESGAAAARFVRAALDAGMPRERVDVRLCAGAVVLPG